MRFLSIDPSLRNTALVWGEIKGDDDITISGYELIQTTKSKNKQIRASSDLIERSRTVLRGVQEIVSEINPHICFAETPSGSQNASGAKSYAISCMIIAALNPPAIEITPIELKVKTVGKKTASKDEIIKWVDERFPGVLEVKRNGEINKGKMEHVADAICATIAGMNTTQFKQLISFNKGR